MRYFSRNPFLGDTDSWRYVQGIADFSLSGHVWDPRFFQFDLGGSFNYTDNSGSAGIHDWRYLGYRIETRFFPQKKVSFGFRYFRNDSGTTRTASEPSPLKYALQEKGIDLSLSRIKHLPSIRVAYLSRSYRSSVSDSPRNEQDNRLDLGVSQTAGISSFNLDYRRETYENQVIERDRSHEGLRLTERLQIAGGTTIWFDGILSNNTLALPSGQALKSSLSQFSGNALSRLSDRLRGNLRYTYVHSSVDGRAFSLHTARGIFHYTLSKNLIVSPIIGFSHSGIEGPEGEEVLQNAEAGARLTWNHNWRTLSWRTYVELTYRHQDSQQQGKAQDLANSFGASLNVGDIDSLLGSLSYGYAGSDTEISIPEYGDPLFYYGFGINLNRHSLRLELRSRALRPLDTYLYSRYDRYERDSYGQGLMETTTGNHGLRLGLGRVSLAGDFGFSDLKTDVTAARYATLSSTLDFKAFRNWDVRAMLSNRKRRDAVMGRDFYRSFSFFVNYRPGLFTASLIYQNIAWELDGPPRRDDVLSVTFTRSFGTRR